MELGWVWRRLDRDDTRPHGRSVLLCRDRIGPDWSVGRWLALLKFYLKDSCGPPWHPASFDRRISLLLFFCGGWAQFTLPLMFGSARLWLYSRSAAAVLVGIRLLGSADCAMLSQLVISNIFIHKYHICRWRDIYVDFINLKIYQSNFSNVVIRIRCVCVFIGVCVYVLWASTWVIIVSKRKNIMHHNWACRISCKISVTVLFSTTRC